MKRCEKCGVQFSGDLDRCPLCQAELSGDASPAVFPRNEVRKSGAIALAVLAFATGACLLVMLFLGHLLQLPGDIVVTVCVGLVVNYLFVRNILTHTPDFLRVVARYFLVLLAIAAWWWRKDLENHPLLMKALIYVIPLPYLGIMAGWAVAEIGRQPWIVYGLMRTSDAVSPVPTSSVGLSLAAFIVIYTFLGILDIYLLRKYAKKGPEAAPEAQA